MAYTTESSYTGNGSNKDFLVTFPFLESADIKARVNGVDTAAFSVTGTTVTFTTAPPNTQVVLLYRDTDIDKTKVVFQAGSSVRAQDLNSLGNQLLYGLQEEQQNTGGVAFATGDKGNIAVNTANSWVINNNVISNAMMLDNSVDSAEIVTGAVDLDHMSSESVDEDNLKISNAGSNGQFLQKQSGNTGGLTWAAANNYSHPNHTGEVTSTGDGATVIADNIVDEANLKISNAGNNGEYLQKQSGNTGGLTWAGLSGLGVLKNLVTANTTTEVDMDQTLTDSGLTCNITPSASGHKVLVVVQQAYKIVDSDGGFYFEMKLFRGSTQLLHRSMNHDASGSANNEQDFHTLIYLDSPSTTSQTTYKMQMYGGQNDAKAQPGGQRSDIFLLELNI